MGKLTDTAIRQAKPESKPFRLSGELGTGQSGTLICRVEPSGIKRLFYRYRTGGTDRMIQLGRYDSRGEAHGLTLADAAEKARAYSNRLKATPDLKESLELERRQQQAERRQQLREHREADENTLQRLLDVYTGHLERQGRGAARDVRTLFRLHVVEAHPDLAGTPAAAVEARDIAKMVRGLIDAGKARTAGKLRSYLTAAFALALKAETDPTAPAEALGFKLAANPAAATVAHSGVQARNRTLTIDELRRYMEQAATLPEVQADALALLLLLGGQRPAQLVRAKVSDVDLDARTLRLFDPKGKRKTPRPHDLPLSDAALKIVKRRREASAKLYCEWLFSTDGKTSMRLETLSECVKNLSDANLNPKSKADLRSKRRKHGYQLRDIRRTCETMLAGLGISRDTRAQLLSHGLSGVQQQHYDRHDYGDEKRATLAAWEARLQSIRSGETPPSNVRELKRA